MNGNNHIRRLSILFLFLSFPIVPVSAQELGPNDIDPRTEDVRCIEKNYRHKTASELDRMIPEELINESAKEWNYHVSLMDKYQLFTLSSYKGKIGIAIIPVLTKLAGDFASRPLSKCQQQRFFTAFAIAADVDDQIVRLRTRGDGQTAISTAEDALKQMKDAGLTDNEIYPYNKFPFGIYLLDRLQGINEHDELMRKLLEEEFGVHLSDVEFFKFVNFLTSTYPTYPSWTPRVNNSRDLQPNRKKYHDAYLQFKKTVQTSGFSF